LVTYSSPPTSTAVWNALRDYEPSGFRELPWTQLMFVLSEARGIGELSTSSDWLRLPLDDWCRVLAFSSNDVITIRWVADGGMEGIGIREPTHDHLLCRDDNFTAVRSGYVRRTSDGTFLLT